MQDTLEKPPIITAEARSIERIAHDRSVYGDLRPETKELVTDEEKTHAAEIIAKLSGEANIPRVYKKVGNDLLDPRGVGLAGTLESGLVDIRRKVASGVVGADKESVRRGIEKDNFHTKILNLPEGFACVETSATDGGWTDEEKEEQGYSGDTMVRITARLDEETFVQANLVVQESSMEFVNNLRRVVNRYSHLARDANEALSDTQIVGVGENFERFVRSLRRRAAELEAQANPAAFVVNTLKKHITARRDAWEFVDSQENADVFDDLVEAFERDAEKSYTNWHNLANSKRVGVWQELCDRFNGLSANKKGTIISNGQKRALAAQMTFIACGGKVEARELLKNIVSISERTQLAINLKSRLQGSGMCTSCFQTGELYGCGVFCVGCNEVWCDEYASTGRELEAYDVAAKRYLLYARPF